MPNAQQLLDDRLANGWRPTPSPTIDGMRIDGVASEIFEPGTTTQRAAMGTTKFPIETQRLVIRPVSNQHGDFLFRLMNDPDFLEFIGDRGISNSAQAVEYIQKPMKTFQESGVGLFAVHLKPQLEAIGICSLLKRDNLPHPDIGYALLPEFRGQGFAVESTQAMLRYAAALGIERMCAVTNQENERSVRLLEKIGLRFDSLIQFDEDGPKSNMFVIDLV